MKQEDTYRLEKELATYIAKDIKQRSGKGPVQVQVKIVNDFILVRLFEFLLPNEVELAKSDNCLFDVKMTRYKWIQVNKNEILEKVSGMLGKEVYDLFYDLNPQQNIAVIVLLFK